MSKPLNSLRKEYRTAENRSDFFEMIRLNFELIVFFLRSNELKAVRKEIKRYKTHLEPLKLYFRHEIVVTEKEALMEGLGQRIENEVFDLETKARNQLDSGSIEQAVELYEIAVELSQVKIIGQFVEELDLADYLAHCYLKQGKYTKALHAFKHGSSVDKGYQQIFDFCRGIKGEAPRALRSFLRKYENDKAQRSTFASNLRADGWDLKE